MEGLTFKQQAHKFAWADIVVVPHGAANSNIIFLRRHAVVIHVSTVQLRARCLEGA
jgi:capsular polysaccharide biosynthesis protein